jgi:hypothetical protein
MGNSTKSFEEAVCFYIGALVILVLDYTARVTGARLGYNFAAEVGLGPEMLFLVGVTLVYYGIFLAIQGVLSRFRRQLLENRYLLPTSFFTGIVVSFTFISELDFLFWFVYKKDMGTILPSVLVVEIMVLLINFAIVWRTSRT